LPLNSLKPCIYRATINIFCQSHFIEGQRGCAARFRKICFSRLDHGKNFRRTLFSSPLSGKSNGLFRLKVLKNNNNRKWHGYRISLFGLNACNRQTKTGQVQKNKVV
jgi:hypothetical protein